MKPHDRRLIVKTVAIGVLLTALVTVAEIGQWLAPLERWLYDRRARDHQQFTPPPTDLLRHIDIDDRALEVIGQFPWPRSDLAAIIEELAAAQAGAIALDLLFLENQERGVDEITQEVIDHDARLEDAIGRAGNVLLPVSFRVEPDRWQSFSEAIAMLAGNLKSTEDLAQAEKSFIEAFDPGAASDRASDSDVRQLFYQALRAAIYARMTELLAQQPDASLTDARAALLPRIDPLITNSTLLQWLGREYERARSMLALGRLVPPVTASMQSLHEPIEVAPSIERISRRAAATSFVNYLPSADGVMREVPLCVRHRGRIYPQMALALACMMSGADLERATLEADRLVVARDDGPDLAIPVHHRRRRGRGGRIEALIHIPWRGPVDNWMMMYGGTRLQPACHLPVTEVWKIVTLRREVEENLRTVDQAMVDLWRHVIGDEARAAAYEADPPPPDDTAIRDPLIQELLAAVDLEVKTLLDRTDDLAEDELWVRDMLQCVTKVPRETVRRKERLEEQIQRIRKEVEGRAVIIGWTATGARADFVPTPLHSICPGVVVHGGVFNAIMTRDFWRRAPRWVTVVLTILIGLLMTAVVAVVTPGWSVLTALVLIFGYYLGTGILVFDYGNVIVGTAGPLAAVGITWPGCTLSRFIIERSERARVERRFRSYVDPALVDYVIAHPEHATLDGQIRELTVVFTDLQGFTTLSERLRERTVPILNEYMGLMVPIIRSHGGYVNKFLGDGMMFFFGAPQGSTEGSGRDACDALMTAMEMQAAIAPFNRSLAASDLPQVRMRVGICTGNMVVGDAGSADASDYTVIGDVVNLASRLESANKATGTLTLINARTAMLVQDEFLLCPVGRLQVVGKSLGEMTFEPLCPSSYSNGSH
ncbi:MAG: hypothetical protein CMJ18_15495, partial [Phycisphaeraceae bacterium]|nr:hypothetical protein [Phycisphaeraceae bacterium]